MSTASRLVIVGALVLAVAATVALRRQSAPAPTTATSSTEVALPRLIDVGADTCVACKAMVPVLEDLRREYVGRLRVDFIDAWKYPDRADAFRVSIIPTQIFIDASGRELHRHLGFISKAEIVETWRQLGVHLTPVGKS
jgi:thioredoxin 1